MHLGIGRARRPAGLGVPKTPSEHRLQSVDSARPPKRCRQIISDSVVGIPQNEEIDAYSAILLKSKLDLDRIATKHVSGFGGFLF
jgi:hypothetical protein